MITPASFSISLYHSFSMSLTINNQLGWILSKICKTLLLILSTEKLRFLCHYNFPCALSHSNICVLGTVLCRTLTPHPHLTSHKTWTEPISTQFWFFLVNNNWRTGNILKWPKATSGFYLHENWLKIRLRSRTPLPFIYIQFMATTLLERWSGSIPRHNTSLWHTREQPHL